MGVGVKFLNVHLTLKKSMVSMDVFPYQYVNPFILLSEAVFSLHGDIFTKYSVSAGSDRRPGKVTLMSGVTKKILEPR